MTITTALLNEVRDAVQTQLEAVLLYGAVGDGLTAPTAGDTILDNETYRAAITEVDTSTPGELTVTIIVGFTSNNGNDVSEVGIFDASSGGEMKQRNLLTPITKTSNIQLYIDFTYTWTVSEV